MTNTPNDRGICGNVIWTAGVTPARCTLIVDHPGWHQDDEGMSWNLGPRAVTVGETGPARVDLGELFSDEFAERFQQAMATHRVTVLPPPSATEQPIVVEHAIGMSGGSMQVRPNDPEIERIYPLAKWIPDHQRHGGKVYTRRVIVVDDWTEVPR